MSERVRSLLSWVVVVLAGTTLGLIAARYRLFDSTAAVVGVFVVQAVLVIAGFWAMAQPWDEWDD